MKWLHLTITVTLAVAVVFLGVVAIQTRLDNSAPETKAKTAPMRGIERMPEFEAAMEKLGYHAWGYKWHGGMIDGTMRVGSGNLPPVPCDGNLILSDLLNFEGALSAAESNPSATVTTVSGTVLVVLGPIPSDSATTSDVPCRVFIEAKLPSGNGCRRDKTNLVEFAYPASSEGSVLRVFGRWNESESGVLLSDSESAYNLLELQWLPEQDPLKTRN